MGRASQVAQATCAHALSPSPPLRCACLLCSFQPPASLPPGASRHSPPLHTPRAMEREIVGEVRVNKTATAKFTPMDLARFVANSLRPLSFQLLETTPGVMTKTIQNLKSSLGF